jgi:hypothetical protein
MKAIGILNHEEALQQGIRRAGESARLARNLMTRVGGLVAFTLLLVSRGLTWRGLWSAIERPLLPLALPLALPLCIAVPAAAALRRLRGRQLQRRLARLPRDEVARILLPLQNDPAEDTRLLVAPLIRDLLAQGTEVAPAVSAGTGSEPAVAE